MRTFRILLLLWINFLLLQTSYSQDSLFSINSKGRIPKEVLELTSSRIKTDQKKINAQNNRATRVAESKFHFENNYFMNQLFRSGAILFGDELSEYVQNVGNYIMKCNPSIDTNIRFYVTKSTDVNAFSTNNGIIFINIGLLAYIKNEAQLAYILCHEIVHYEKKHTIDRFTESFKLENTNKLNFIQKLDTYVKYSKTQEEVADSLGFIQYFANTKYTLDESIEAFEVLRFSDFPIEDVPFDIKFLVSDSNYLVPAGLSDLKIKPWKPKDDLDDSEHLHPNILKRIMSLRSLLEELNDSAKETFIVSQKDFYIVKNLAQRELARLYIQNGQYENALYHSFCMLKKVPADTYYKSIATYSLYAMAKYKARGKSGQTLTLETDRGGGHIILQKYLKSLSIKDMYKLAVRNLFSSWRDEKCTFSKQLLDDLLKEIYMNAQIADQISSELKSNDKSFGREYVIISNDEYEKLSKIDKIKYDKWKEKSNKLCGKTPNDDIWVGLVSDSIFVKFYLTEYASSQNKFKQNFKEIDTTKDENKVSESRKLNAENLMLDTLVVFNPFYYKSVYKKTRLDRIEKKKVDYLHILESNAVLSDLNVEIIDILNVTDKDIQLFNDFSIVNSWAEEYFRLNSDLDSIDDSGYSIIPFHQPYMEIVMKKHNTKYIGFTGVISVTGFRNLSGYKTPLLIVLTMFYLPAPITLYYFLTPSNKTMYTFLVMDVTTGKFVFNDMRILKGKDNKSLLKSQVYNTYYEFKN